ncbi:hypothetical protein VZT92_023759 [Zoarces viviparus]|uniref:Secreted protein n=1 Tax=Zoarces viviparus TaxID=48416 RepID=A0AAW1E8I4_ZOAVI
MSSIVPVQAPDHMALSWGVLFFFPLSVSSSNHGSGSGDLWLTRQSQKGPVRGLIRSCAVAKPLELEAVP